MSTHRDHSEYNPSRLPENPNQWEIPINRGISHSLRYGLVFLAKLYFFACSSMPLIDLSIGVPLADTPLVSHLLRGCASRRTGNKWRRLTYRQFSDSKDEDLTIAGRLLDVEVTVGLGGLRFGEMEEGKGRGFDDTFWLSTLVVVVIFLLVAFSVLSLIIMMVFPSSKLMVYSPDLDIGYLLVLLDLWLCRVFGNLCDLKSRLPIDRQILSLVGALLSRTYCMLVSGVLRYFPVFGPQTCVIPTVRQLFVLMVED
ncbi:hypothetical protein TIFTF001_029313 [Ficus carica]|uniref:Uncharacterized protein n=1 Tax=Ficus carica TaxID=3494 RepID=A0AA88DS66_FICCA|nr:hypothetical protein TIFTF001_029313 [Ficus carica]